MAPRRQNHCYAPGCQTGYVHVKGAPKPSLFVVPRDERLRRLWENNLHRADKPLEDTSAVCELHFEPRYVIRDYVHTIGGKEVRIPRGRPMLSSDAVPTILPNLPSYLTKKAVKERPPRKRKSESHASPVKRRLCTSGNSTVLHTNAVNTPDPDAAASRPEDEQLAIDVEVSSSENPQEDRKSMSLFSCLEVPSPHWTKHIFPDHKGIVYCTSVLTPKNEVRSEKVVMFFESRIASYCKVFIRGTLLKEGTVETEAAAEEVLKTSDRMCICVGAISHEDYEERFFTKKLKDHVVTCNEMYFSIKCLGQVDKKGAQCVSCRYLKRALQIRRARVKRTATRNCQYAALKLRVVARRNTRLFSRLKSVKKKLEQMQIRNAAIKTETLEAQIARLPPRQQEAVRQCFAASRVKPNGLRYTKSWVLDCLIMKMKSPRLYEHLRRNNILALPCKSTLKRYVHAYRTVFGFSERVLKQLKEKTAELDVWKKHGGLVIDELKLSEHFSVKKSGAIEGFVDLGPFTTSKDKGVPCDHGMVILFVPFQGKWSQVIGYFATHGNMKGDTLAKVVIEATILAEKSGLFVDFITCDGASWNRNMWKVLGIQATADSTTSKIEHPSDASRHLYFISDFPHLIKCLRNSLLKSGFNTPAGHVDMQHVREAHKIDSSNVTLKVMPGITRCHLDPNGFEKMRVSYAFQLFGTKVLQAFHLYKDKLEATLGRMDVTQEFFSKIHQLIRVMTSRFPAEALRPCSSGTAVLQDFLSYLKAWEQHTKGGGGFLSNSTAAGLRVTISSTLELLDYLTENVGFKYLMTAKTSQDPLENLFGIIRQSSGSNDHPTPTQFLITVNCMSFYGLVKGVSQGNCEEGMLGSLLEVSSPRDTSQNAAGMDLAPSSSPNAQALVIPSQDHSQHVARSDSRIIFYIAGYVARKCILKSNCKDCLILLTAPAPDESFQLARLTLVRDNGGLLYPSACLFRFIKKLEDLFTGCFSCEQLHADSILDVLTIVKARLWQEVGCPSHVSMLSQKIIQFYVVTRLHFYIKGLNTDRAGKRQKAKHLKISRCC